MVPMLHHGLMACGVPVICIESRRPAKTIPIVFVFVSDPVGGGFVGSIAHPGGNITDFAQLEASLAGKWIGLLKELVPNEQGHAFRFACSHPIRVCASRGEVEQPRRHL